MYIQTEGNTSQRRGNAVKIFISGVTAMAFFVFAGSALAAGPLPVNLLSAGNFVIFADTAIANPAASSVITGDIGTGPGVTSTAITGFGLILPGGGAFSTSAQITGNVYAHDYAVPTPTMVTTASTDMLTAYNDAAGGRTPTVSELGAGNISGMTLAPGTYKWSTSVQINTNVTLSGSASDVWIFQIAGDLNVASLGDLISGVHVVLTGGAQASNVFWQVGGPTGATLGTFSTFNGTILSAKQIIMQTGAVLNGRALAQTQVTLDHNTVTFPVVAPTSGPVFIDTNTNGVLDNGEQFFQTLQAAVNAASTTGDTIGLGANITETAQTTVNKSVTIDGNGFTLHATFAKTDNSNNSAIGIFHSNVTVMDLIEDGTGSPTGTTGLHGINIFQSTGVNLNNVTVSHNGHAGIIVNGSTVAVNNITTASNVWYGIDVDQGSGVTSPASLTVNGVSSHSDVGPAILVDDITKNVSVTDTNNQYSFVDVGNVRVYNLKTITNPTIDLGTFVGGVGTTTATTTITNGSVNVGIASGTVVTSTDTSWDGVINLPVATSTPTITPDPGNTVTVVSSVEVGHGDSLVTFNLPVRLTFVGQAGKLVGSSRAGVFTPITAVCSDDTQAMNDANLAPGADCKISVGADLIVWTKHFTVFTTYTQTAIPAPAPSGGGGGGGGGGPIGLFGTTNVNTSVTQTVTGLPNTGTVVLPNTGNVVSSYNFIRNLVLGSRGQDVTELQNRLVNEGFLSSSNATGYFGKLTMAAVKKFQLKYGVQAVGTVGPKTRLALNASVNLPNTGLTADEQARNDSINAQIQVLLGQVMQLQAKLKAQTP